MTTKQHLNVVNISTSPTILEHKRILEEYKTTIQSDQKIKKLIESKNSKIIKKFENATNSSTQSRSMIINNDKNELNQNVTVPTAKVSHYELSPHKDESHNISEMDMKKVKHTVANQE